MSNYEPKYFTSYSPKVRVLVKDVETAELLYDLTDDLTSLSTNKAYGRCSGTWQLMVTYQSNDSGKILNWADELAPNMMVTIEMDAGNGFGYFPVMCGLIDRISKVRGGGHIPQRSVKVSGRDMGKLLETHDVGLDIIAYNQALAAQDETKKNSTLSMARQFDPGFSMGTPGQFMRKAFDTVLDNMLASTKRLKFTDYTNDKWQMSQPTFMTSQGMSFWNFIKQMEHAPYSILTTDTNTVTPNFFHVHLEKYPYNNETGHIERDEKQWHTIGDAEIISDDLGVCDQERINMVSFQPAIYLQTRIMSEDVMMAHKDLTKWEPDLVDIKKNGLAPKQFVDKFTPPDMYSPMDADDYRKDAAIKTASAMATMLWNWYKKNHTYESGSATVHLRPDVRVGSGLLIKQGSKDEYKEYFIEQVSHQCTFHPTPQFTTSLHLTRGQKPIPATKSMAAPPAGGSK